MLCRWPDATLKLIHSSRKAILVRSHFIYLFYLNPVLNSTGLEDLSWTAESICSAPLSAYKDKSFAKIHHLASKGEIETGRLGIHKVSKYF